MMARAERMLLCGFDTHRADVSGWIGWKADAAELSFANRDM